MSEIPAYFETIRQMATRRWNQLEGDPGLAGPWHQLFKQVQSPRHILSELLQNADDAGATEASARVEGQVFIFEHNGGDFSEEHFHSLCNFGYSNKRALHTIGFRGIGFKSTFSLGDQVDLFTPTLSTRFHRRRFTEPQWLTSTSDTQGNTRIEVAISDLNRQHEVEKNLDDWLKSSLSLLFFRNIRRLHIGEREVHWGSLGPGPVAGSEWMALHESADESYLLIRSSEEAFPAEALEEIRQERMLGTEDETEFPPCRIEIVLGAKGRLYVVLPTGVETELPFACNAPFIQDPARVKIKDPETSPTNRWLLERAGKLAAATMLDWLGQTETTPAERVRAYGLFPDVDREINSLEGVCGTSVEEAFASGIEGKDVLLVENGQLAPAKRAVIVPTQVLDVWRPEQAASLLDVSGRPPLCPLVDSADRRKLLHWGLVDEITRQKLLAILQQKHLPKPESWRKLLNLWLYVAPEMTGYSPLVNIEKVRIVPVQGKDVLYAANEVVRLGEKKLLQSEDDWEFLAKYLIVVSPNWLRFLAEQRRAATELIESSSTTAVKAAFAILEKIGLEETSNVDKVVELVAMEFFSQKNIPLSDCAQLAQIAAKLGVTVGEAFRYATRDRHLRSIDKGLLVDEDGGLEVLLPEDRRDVQLLHDAYSSSFVSCSREDWQKWIASGRAGLLTFIPLAQTRVSVHGRHRIEEIAKKRGVQHDLSYAYVTGHFVVEDWDFDVSYWRHWRTLAASDERLWLKLTDRILSQREGYWTPARSARLLQVATTGSMRSVTPERVLPSWALRLRELPCLSDTRGFPSNPNDLLRRTPETEAFMDVEPFVHALSDREVTRPLLDLLGVRSKPTGPDRLIDRLRALAKAEKPPIHEVEKWYRRLDQIVDTCSTGDFQKIRRAFQSEKLILPLDGMWAASPMVFLASGDDDVPDAALIRPSVADLALWRKIGIAERPSVDLAVAWLKALPPGKALPSDDARRARGLLVRHPIRIWEETQHWLNLAGEWTPTDKLAYALTMQSLVPWSHLHPWVKQKTADLQRLPAEITGNPPFSILPPLSAQIEDRLQSDPLFRGQPATKEWLRTLGTELSRIEFDSEDETSRVRSLAEALAMTRWLETSELEMVPYIDGTPAGTPRRASIVWVDRTLYVEPLPRAKLARLVPEEIGKAFARPDIKAALDYSFERPPQDIREYLDENFKLAAAFAAPVNPVDGGDTDTPEPSPPPENTEDATNIEAPADDSTEGTDNGQTIVDQFGSLEGIDVPDPPDPRPRPTPQPVKPGIMERFARAQGFRKDGEERFFHEGGSWIGRANGTRFPWERRAASGDLICYYWPKDHCLEREPLQLEADIWGLIDQNPDTYALILSSIEGNPVEITGARLHAMKEKGEVILYPATYRLVYDQSHA